MILLSNSAAFSGLAKRCPGTSIPHTHACAFGRRRIVEAGVARTVSVAMLAGRYPRELCAALAQCVLAELRATGKQTAPILAWTTLRTCSSTPPGDIAFGPR